MSQFRISDIIFDKNNNKSISHKYFDTIQDANKYLKKKYNNTVDKPYVFIYDVFNNEYIRAAF